MKNLFQKAIGVTLGGVVAVGLATNASAMSMTVDTVLADDSSIATADATVDMMASGNVLTITLANLFNGSGAGGLLTGLAFNMPDNVDILGGTVVLASGSTIVSSGALNGSGAGTVISGEWGFRNGISGHFNDFGTATDTQVSAMVADGTTKFSDAWLEKPEYLDGPEFGLLGPIGTSGGNTAIRNSVVITLTLSRDVNGGFLNGIESGVVAVTYGSPTGVSVP